jgi:hypothetical protein
VSAFFKFRFHRGHHVFEKGALLDNDRGRIDGGLVRWSIFKKCTGLSLRGWSPHKQWVSDSRFFTNIETLASVLWLGPGYQIHKTSGFFSMRGAN